MRKGFWVLSILALLVVSATAVAQDAQPQQSKISSPVRPPGVIAYPVDPTKANVIIPGVPSYLWRHGCGPTAVAMVLGYWDLNGFPDLFPGDASTQTAVIDQSIASGGDYPPDTPWPPGSEHHYEDYSRPVDAFPTLITDDVITSLRTPHADDCLADFMLTSRSNHPSGGNYYGWSWSTDVGPAFLSYVSLMSSSYSASFSEYSPLSGVPLTFSILKTEIDNNRPMVFLVDSDGNGDTDHFVCVIGYIDDVPSDPQYIFYDTWIPLTPANQAPFQPLGAGVWSIWGGWTFELEDLTPVFDGIRFSVDPGSVGVTSSGVNYNNGIADPNQLEGDIYLGWNDTNQIDIPLFLLGLQPDDNVDALCIPELGRPDLELEETINTVIWHFGVDRPAIGVQGAPPDVYSEAALHEAAGDIFFANGGGDGSAWGANQHEISETWIGLLKTPLDEKDALDILGQPELDGEILALDSVFFSLDIGSPSLGSATPANACPGDILAPNGTGGFYVAWTAAQLGLVAGSEGAGYSDGDNVDALYVDASNVPVYSVAPGGASALPPGDIYMRPWMAPWTPVLVLSAAQLGLQTDDNLDAVDVTDAEIEGGEGEGEGEGETEDFIFTMQPVGGWFKVGDSLSLQVQVSGAVGTVTYQWTKDGADINTTDYPSAATSNFQIPSLVEDDSGWYACVVTDTSKTDYTSESAHVEVFSSMPAASVLTLGGIGAALSAFGLWQLRRRKRS